MTRSGLPPRERLLRCHGLTGPQRFQLCRRLLCANDPVALGAMHALNQAGLRVPQDFAVAGFDDIDDNAYGLVPLTSVSPDKRQIAELAVSLLIDRIRGAEARGRLHLAGFELAIRASSSRTA